MTREEYNEIVKIYKNNGYPMEYGREVSRIEEENSGTACVGSTKTVLDVTRWRSGFVYAENHSGAKRME